MALVGWSRTPRADSLRTCSRVSSVPSASAPPQPRHGPARLRAAAKDSVAGEGVEPLPPLQHPAHLNGLPLSPHAAPGDPSPRTSREQAIVFERLSASDPDHSSASTSERVGEQDARFLARDDDAAPLSTGGEPFGARAIASAASGESGGRPASANGASTSAWARGELGATPLAPLELNGHAAANGLAPQLPMTLTVAARPDKPRDSLAFDTTDLYDADATQLPDVGVLLLATAVGLSTGAGVVLFNSLVHAVQDELVWSDAPRIAAFGSFFLTRDPAIALWHYLLLPPLVGGAAVSVLREGVGGFEGDPKCVRVVAGDAPYRPFRASAPQWLLRRVDEGVVQALIDSARPYVKFLAAALTLGSGASLGPEGPSVDMGKANAASIARGAQTQDRKIATDLLAAGAGAGVAAGFGAPMAGVVFAVETVLLTKKAAAARGTASGPQAEEMTTDDGGLLISTVLIACVIASIVSKSGIGVEAVLRVPDYQTLSLFEAPLFISLGLVCGGTSAIIASLCRSTERSLLRLRRSGVPAPAMPLLGGLACGSLAMLFPEITYQGFENVNALMRLSAGPGALYSATMLAQLVAVKALATAVCRSSGLVGGLYAPSLFIGAALGSAFCMVCQNVVDLGTIAPGAALAAHHIDLLSDLTGFALVGAAAMLAAQCRVPLTSVLLVFELTQDYTIVLPTLATVGIARWASATLDRKIKPSLYRSAR